VTVIIYGDFICPYSYLASQRADRLRRAGMAVPAYAEAVSDGIADELRGSLFRAIWARGLNWSSPHEAHSLVTGLMWPREDVAVRLASPDFPSLLLRDTDMTRIVRRSGGTIALNGVPLTTAGWRRVRQWRGEWLALPSQVIPAVIGSDHIARRGVEGLRYLAEFARTAGLPASLAAQAETAPGRNAGQLPAARAA
jgi:hypothetical protein